MSFSWSRPSPEQIAAALTAARQQQPAYDGVGSTAATSLTAVPKGYRQGRYQLHLGHGAAVFTRAVEALDSWQAQRGTGITVTPADAVPQAGQTIVQCIRMGPLWTLAPCRVVYRIEEPDRVGFGYGSLAAHPVRGEEAFLVERDAAGVVRVRILVFSKPNRWLVRLGGPIGRFIQWRTAKAYLAGIRRYVLPS